MNFFSTTYTESDLIAFHMNELSPRRSRSIRRAIEQSPMLAAEAASVAATLREFKHSAPVLRLDATVMENNWQAVRSSIQPFAAPVTSTRGLRTPLLIGSGIAVFAALTVAAGLHRAGAAHNGTGDVSATSSGAHDGVAQTSSGAARQPTHSMIAVDSPFVAVRASDASSTRRSLQGQEWNPSPTASRLTNNARLIPLATKDETSLHYPSFEQLTPGLAMAPLLPMPRDLHVIPVPYTAIVPNVGSQVTEKPRKPRSQRDLLLAIGGDFIAPHTSTSGDIASGGEQIHTQSTTHAVVAMAAFHQQLRPWVGYRVAVSYARPGFDYGYSAKTPTTITLFGTGEVNTRIYEAVGTYVVQGPHHHKLTTTADAGGGLMAFLPTNSYQAVSYVYRGAAVLGVNADISLSKHIGVRAGYRAQLFKSPDFRNTDGSIPVTSSVTVSSEPFVGITYRFGSSAND